ncbi:MAG TPA: acetate uptake transporter [Ktedonobacteraceae bacterium]|nr:acetate uptake transporter [Ktedonobacteraceae bacterium]
MRDYNTSPVQQEPAPVEPVRDVASPAPLGLNVFAFATAILGCFYAGFIIPYQGLAIRPAVGAILVASGVVLILAGMWEYRKNSVLSATIFTSYGGFLAAIGLIFLPNLGILSILLGSGAMNFAMGLFFLCWTIFTGILFIGTLGSNISLAVTMLLLFLAYAVLTAGQLASGNTIITIIGGWVAIVAALAAWFTGLASLLGNEGFNVPGREPLRRRLVPVE